MNVSHAWARCSVAQRSTIPSTLRASATSSLSAGSYVYQQGAHSSAIYVIRSGVACLESVNRRGERCIVHFLGKGAMIGHEALREQLRCFDARACTDIEIERVKLRGSLNEIQHDDPLGSVDLLALKMLQDITTFRIELHRANANQRVLLMLELLKSAHPPEALTIWLPSRQDMADMLDMNHVTASRVVANLYRSNILLRGTRHDRVGVDWAQVGRWLQAD